MAVTAKVKIKDEPPLFATMRALADEGHPRGAELRAAADDYQAASAKFGREGCFGTDELVRRWQLCRQLMAECTKPVPGTVANWTNQPKW